MQTFLPEDSFIRSAKVLDRQRLGKQRVEAWQILRALRGETKGWTTHPATIMWSGYETALAEYAATMCTEWARRGYVDNMYPRFAAILREANHHVVLPHWLGDEEFHASHRSNLLRKDYEFYSRYDWTEPDNLPYVWPAPLDTSPIRW